MTTPSPRYVLATPKVCTACDRTVFAADDRGRCPGCQRKAL